MKDAVCTSPCFCEERPPPFYVDPGVTDVGSGPICWLTSFNDDFILSTVSARKKGVNEGAMQVYLIRHAQCELNVLLDDAPLNMRLSRSAFNALLRTDR